MIDARMIDAPDEVEPCDLDCPEGGEVRWEYLEFPDNDPVRTDRTRGTAFFYGGASSHHPLPDIPGCTDMTADPPTRWPLAQDEGRQLLDVGDVIISGGPAPFQLTKRVPGTATEQAGDFLNRVYDGTWYFRQENNAGRAYLTDDTVYDVTITGGSGVAPTVFTDVLYIPNRYPLIDPPQLDISDPPVSLEAGTALDITYTVPTNTNLPAGAEVDTLVAFLHLNGNPPAIFCIEEGIDGAITIPANMVDIVRDSVDPDGNGSVNNGVQRFLRQHVVHQVRDLPDDSGTQKRIDFLSVWCYNYTYQTAPAP